MTNPMQYDKDLNRYAQFLTKDRSKVPDLVQATYMKAYGNLSYFDGKNLKAWLFTIMKNTYVNQVTKKEIVSCCDLNNLSNMFSGNSTYHQVYAKEIEQEIARLTPNIRTTFDLHLQGYKYEEIAERLDITISAVKSRISYARGKLITRV